jgi:hypothetical protein
MGSAGGKIRPLAVQRVETAAVRRTVLHLYDGKIKTVCI